MTSTAHLCPLCRQPIHDTGTICTGDTKATRLRLLDVPDLLTELDHTTLRQARISTPGTDTPDGHALPWNEHAAQKAHALRTTVHRHAFHLLQDLGLICGHPTCHTGAQPACHGHPHTALAARAPHAWLAAHTAQLRMRPWAATAAIDIRTATAKAWAAIDRPEQRYYAGPCHATMPDPQRPNEDVLCGVVLWARIDQPAITCPGCRTTYPVAARRDWLMRAAEDLTAPASEIASALTLMTRTRLPEATIRSWARRRVLTRTDHPPGPRPLYRIGDVLTLLTRNEPTTDQDPTDGSS